MHFFRRTQSRQFVLWLLFATVLLRTAIPDGFMPERQTDGSVSLGYCHAGALAHLRVGDPTARSDRSSHEECVFAAAVVPVLPATEMGVFPLAQIAAILTSLNFFKSFNRYSTGRPPARGPPVVS